MTDALSNADLLVQALELLSNEKDGAIRARLSLIPITERIKLEEHFDQLSAVLDDDAEVTFEPAALLSFVAAMCRPLPMPCTSVLAGIEKYCGVDAANSAKLQGAIAATETFWQQARRSSIALPSLNIARQFTSGQMSSSSDRLSHGFAAHFLTLPLQHRTSRPRRGPRMRRHD